MLKERTWSTGYCSLLLLVGLPLMGVATKMIVPWAILTVPLFIAVLFVWQRKPFGVYGAVAIFLFWMTVLVLMWMHMLHYHDIALAHHPLIVHTVIQNFSIPAIVLSAIIGLFGLWGLIGSISEGAGGSVLERLAGFAVFGALQIVALWVSVQAYFAHR